MRIKPEISKTQKWVRDKCRDVSKRALREAGARLGRVRRVCQQENV